VAIFNYTVPHQITLKHVLDCEYGDPYYGSTRGGDVYFSRRLRSDDWEQSSEGDKQKSLFEATSMVDRLNFKGAKSISTQRLQFPRDGDTRIPTDIEYATYEIAILLLGGLDPEAETSNLSSQKNKFGNIHIEYHERRSPFPYMLAGIYSAKAWRFLFPYIRDSKTVDIVRAD